MTPEELETLVLEAKDPWEIQKAFAPLTDKERKKLSTAASKLNRDLSRFQPNKDMSDPVVSYLRAREKGMVRTRNGNPIRFSILAMFACCPLSKVKNEGVYFRWQDADVLGQIMLDRRPEWMNEWVLHALEQDMPSLDFLELRRWVKEGACEKPDTDGYYRLFANHMMGLALRGMPALPPLSQQLTSEPDLLDDVWGIFRVESNAFNTNSWFTANAPDDYETWTDALLKLSESGHLDRQKLLDASLEGLSLDIKQNELAGFHKFHKALAPTKEERAARQPDYLALLSHRVGHVVKFALGVAGQIEKDGALETVLFIREIPTVLLGNAKGNAKAGLKLTNRVLKRNGEPAALLAVTEALKSPHADVQELALDILSENEERLTDEIRAAIRGAADYVPVSLHGRLTSVAGAPNENASIGGDLDQENAASVDAILDGLSVERLDVIGVDRMRKSEPFSYAPISPSILDHEILPTVEPLAPIETLEELIEEVSHTIEAAGSPDAFERIVDGIARLCGERPADFDERVGPLLHRIRPESDEHIHYQFYSGLLKSFLNLVLTWLTGRLNELAVDPDDFENRVFTPLSLHFSNVAGTVKERKPQQLLCVPTHTNGWIDPATWAERLSSAEAAGQSHHHSDFCLSVLRLAPDNRATALEILSGLQSPMVRPAKFALGALIEPSRDDGKNYALWISAARARAPDADWREAFQPLALDDPWPDSLQPAVYRWCVYLHEAKAYRDETKPYTGPIWKLPKMEASVEPVVQFKESKPPGGFRQRLIKVESGNRTTDWRQLPTVAPHCESKEVYYWESDVDSTWAVRWLPYLWPLYTEGAFFLGARRLAARIDEDGSIYEPNHGHFQALFQKNRPWLENGHLLLCLGLVGKDADSRGLAVDATIEGIESGQFDPGLFVQSMLKLSEGGWLKPNRLGANLSQIIQVSRLHGWVMADCLMALVARADIKQRNVFHIFDVLLEALSQTKRALSPEASHALSSLKGSSKAAKTAKKLLALNEGSAQIGAAVRHQAIEARVRMAGLRS